MKEHFLPDEHVENHVRYLIFKLMVHFEGMDDIVNKLLEFNVSEKKALDKIENHLIEMEKLHLELTKKVKELEKQKTLGEDILYESSQTNEAVRRTFNLLTGLNVIDLNQDAWVSKMTRALVDKIYYRQIKALIFKKTEPTIEDI